jgi:hypothetical protein
VALVRSVVYDALLAIVGSVERVSGLFLSDYCVVIDLHPAPLCSRVRRDVRNAEALLAGYVAGALSRCPFACLAAVEDDVI